MILCERTVCIFTLQVSVCVFSMSYLYYSLSQKKKTEIEQFTQKAAGTHITTAKSYQRQQNSCTKSREHRIKMQLNKTGLKLCEYYLNVLSCMLQCK